MNVKIIRLERLSIENFKGCRNLTLDFSGRSATLYGDNASGKTTVYDALTWLLFGKDSRGRKDFEIKPLGADGKILDHAAVTAVEAELSVDGVSVTLKRTYYEKWSAKRGSSVKTYDGNTGECFTDGVPVKKYEYERRVGEIVTEELFRTLTNVAWFCEGLDWRSRRNLLLEICALPNDRAMMAAEPERFSALESGMGNLSVDDYKRKLLATRKGLNGARDTLPARMDEHRKTIDELSRVDFATLRASRDRKAAEMERLSGEAVKLGNGTLLDGKRNELAEARNGLAALENENTRFRQSQAVPVEDKRPSLEAELRRREQAAERAEEMSRREDGLISGIEARIDDYRKRWRGVAAEQFTASACPTCGQLLPPEAQETARKAFDADKKRRKGDIEAAAGRENENLTASRSRRETYLQEAKEAREAAATLTEELRDYNPPALPEVTDMPDYGQKRADLEGRIAALTQAVDALQREGASAREKIDGQITALRGEIAEIDRQLAREEMLTLARRRQGELQEEARKTARELETLDGQLNLCEEFTRYKVRYIEDAVNRRFQMARFKLFDEQINGGLADCCEATFEGVPYGSLNNGMRVNIGVDVIRTVSEHYGLRVPLVVDNAESVVSLADAGTQVIRLKVSGEDKELRCEYEN